jgi:hypothetical protein
MTEPRPHPLNTPGDYFVEDACCLTCDVPFVFAPDLFAWEHDGEGRPVHCYVKTQPETPEERGQIFEAIRHAEAGCIIYRGGDRGVQERLVEAGEGAICVGLPPDLQARSDRLLAERAPVGQPRPGLWRRIWLAIRGRADA